MRFRNEIFIEERIDNKKFLEIKRLLEKENIFVKKIKNKIIIESEDFFNLSLATNVIEAFLVGFDPKDSIKILQEDYRLYKIDIKDFSGKKINHIKRLKGRVIGKEGKALRYIQKISGSKIIVKDRYIYILGKVEEVEIAKGTIERLLRGSPHSSAFKYMETRKRELKKIKIFEDFYKDFP